MKNNIKKFGEVFTPEYLVKEIIEKLPKNLWIDKNLKWIDHSCGNGNFLIQIKEKLMSTLESVPLSQREKWITENMLYGVEIQEKNVNECSKRLDCPNIYLKDALDFDFYNMKFDVVIGNPPYNDDSGNKGKSHILWDKFLVKSIEICKDNGIVCLITPSLWRKPKNNLFEIFKNNNLIYLEIHGFNDGEKTFRVETRFDWYIIKKEQYQGKTEIKDENGEVFFVNINNYEWLPNCNYDLINNIIAKENDEKCQVIHDRTNYGADKKWVQREKDDVFKYPCVYSVNRENEPKLVWSSTNQNGHFGIPKVIFGSGRTGFYIDKEGQYGLTQWATGVVDKPENLKEIAEFLNSDKFKPILKATSMSKEEINSKILKLFKKDFYKVGDSI